MQYTEVADCPKREGARNLGRFCAAWPRYAFLQRDGRSRFHGEADSLTSAPFLASWMNSRAIEQSSEAKLVSFLPAKQSKPWQTIPFAAPSAGAKRNYRVAPHGAAASWGKEEP
jgi:hypothetical protein